MPPPPVPAPIERFLSAPHPAVVALAGDRGQPVSNPTWYLYENEQVLLSMGRGGRRHRHLLSDPRVALTVLADDWYSHVSLLGRVVEFHDDLDLLNIDRISRHYDGEPYGDRSTTPVTASVQISRWYTYGDPTQ